MGSVKYILIITVILFAFVFLVTIPSTFGNNNDTSKPSETSSTSESTVTTEETPVPPIVVGESSLQTTTSGSDNMRIDNKWALFLVNQTHPLPKNYKVTTKVVQGDKVMDIRAADCMIKMIAAAKKDGVNLNVISSYRTVEYQQKLLDKEISSYKTMGYNDNEAYAKAVSGVAIPGQSEHNAGLAADIVEAGNSTLSENFDTTKEFEWLSKHAHEYGFILRYPKGKQDITGIYYEPWHYRFVGVYYATKIKQSNLTLEEFMEKNKLC